MKIKRISATGNHCNFCQSGKLVDGGLEYPYNKVTSITSGKNGGIGIHVCDACLTEISNIQKTETHVCHIETSIMFEGTKEQCQAHKDEKSYNTDSLKINSIENYGDDCYSDGYDNGYDSGFVAGEE